MSPNNMVTAIFRRPWEIVSAPHTVWSALAAERADWKNLVLRYSLPLSAFTNGVVFLESILLGIPTDGGRLPTPIGSTALFYLFTTLTAPLMFVVLGRCAQHFSQKLGVISPLDTCIALTTYAGTPLYFAWLLSRLPYSETFSQLLALYSVYLAAYGSGTMLHLNREQQIQFGIGILLSSLILSMALAFIIGPLLPHPSP